MHYLCLVLQHDSSLAPATNAGLASFGIKPYCVDSASAASRMLSQWHFDAILLDADGFGHRAAQLLVDLSSTSVPILFASRELDEDRQLRILEMGATEVVTKPISLRLAAMKLVRLAEIRQRAENGPPAEFACGPLRLDTQRQRVSAGGEPIRLTCSQFEILLLLASRAGEFVHRQTIARAIRTRDGTSRSIDMQISKIRRRLREAASDPVVIHTVYGRGYCLTADAALARAAAAQDAWCA